MYLVLFMLWIVWLLGTGASIVLGTPSTPLGWITLTWLCLAFVSHVVLVIANRPRESILVPGSLVVHVIASYFMLSSVPALMPTLLESGGGVADMIRWLVGMP